MGESEKEIKLGQIIEKSRIPSLSSHPSHSSHHQPPKMETLEIEPKPSHRKPPSKSKKKPIPKKKLAIINQKLAFLSQNLKPFPFVPNPQTPTLIPAHELLFRSLNLWDFANLHLDSQIKIHLLSELIAYYDPNKHHSLVRGLRINVNRTDLTRALKLPLKSHRSGTAEFDANKFGGGDEIASAIWGFILSKMVFLDDAGILPEEVVNAIGLVKKGLPNRVDWAQLMWNLVRKELKELSEVAPADGKCYYASHLQLLMKCQKPRLFEEAEGEGDLQIAEEDGCAEEVEDVGGDDKCGPGLNLGVDEDCEESKKGEEEECGLNCKVGALECKDLSKEDMDKSGKGECDKLSKGDENTDKRLDVGVDDDLVVAKLGTSECENLSKEELDKGERVEGDAMSKEEEEEEEEEDKRVDGGFDDELAKAKFPTLERLTSSDFMQVIGSNNNLSFCLDDQPNGEFLAMGSDMHSKSMELDLGPGGAFLFGNEHKRASDEIDDHVNGFNQHHQQKRFRSNHPWEHTPTISGFDDLREQLHHVMGKARMDLIEKEQACLNAREQMRYLNELLQQKDEIIQSLGNTRMEELRKRQIEACRFEHDLRTLSNTLFGCKKALKDTLITFAEYRNKFPIGNKLSCGEGDKSGRDVLDGGLTKPCLAEDEEMRRVARSMIKDFGNRWFEKLNKHATWISMSATKLVKIRDELKLLKERLAKAKHQHG